MKKVITFFLCVCICICFCACDIAPEQTTPPTGAGQKPNPGEILIDNDTLSATFMGAQDASSLGVFYVTLRIENRTDSDIVITLEDADVDGEAIPLITTGVPLVIRPGTNGQTGFIFSMVNLTISSMSEAEKATFRIVARDNTTFDTVYKSELVTVDLN